MRLHNSNDREGIEPSDLLLVDRRRRGILNLRLLDFGLLLQSVALHKSPLGPAVFVARLTRADGAEGPLPIRLSSGSETYRRLLDRFYLPILPDPIISTALFDICASSYDEIIDQERNIQNILRLLGVIKELVTRQGKTIRVLDFGCGTGLAVTAQRRPRSRKNFQIQMYGTDASPVMGKKAAARGERVLSFAEWQKLTPKFFDAIFASYVLHCGIEDRELKIIAKQLMPGGIFVANYFRADHRSLVSIRKRAALFGLVSKTKECDLTDVRNPIIIFRPSDRN